MHILCARGQYRGRQCLFTCFTRIFWYCRSEEDSEGNRDICSEMLQMRALERLTSTVSVRLSGECLLLYQLLYSCTWKVWPLNFCSNRYKVSWLQLSPEKLVKHVSVPAVHVQNATEKHEKDSIFFNICFVYLVSLQYRSRTLKRWKLVNKSLAHPVRKAAR